jgi:hypothetical protein
MPMREDCRHFGSRTYDDGEVARFCVLDLAPEAPWRCPEHCGSYEPSVVDATFETGALSRPVVEDEPTGETPDAIADLLDDAERIVDDAEPSVLRDIERDAPRRRSWWRRLRRSRADDGDDGDDWHLSNR